MQRYYDPKTLGPTSVYDQMADMGTEKHGKVKEWMVTHQDLAAALFMAMAIVLIVLISIYLGKAIIDKFMVHVAPSWWSKFLAKKAAAADAASTAFAQIVAAGKKSGFEGGVSRGDYTDQTSALSILNRGNGPSGTRFQHYGGQANFATPEDISEMSVHSQGLPHLRTSAPKMRADGCHEGSVATRMMNGKVECIPAQDCSEDADTGAYHPMDYDKADAELYEGMIGR